MITQQYSSRCVHCSKDMKLDEENSSYYEGYFTFTCENCHRPDGKPLTVELDIHLVHHSRVAVKKLSPE